MPASNPRVKPCSPRTRDEFVTICVAGCAGKPAIVQMLPMPVESRAGEMRTTAGSLDGPRRPVLRSPPDTARRAPMPRRASPDAAGPPGQVLQRMPGLPPPAKPVPRGEADAGNEPLDVGR